VSKNCSALVHQIVRESGYEEVLSSGIVLTGGIGDDARDAGIGGGYLPQTGKRLGMPEYTGQLADVVRSPRYATVLGLLVEAKKQYLRGHIVTRQEGSVNGGLVQSNERVVSGEFLGFAVWYNAIQGKGFRPNDGQAPQLAVASRIILCCDYLLRTVHKQILNIHI
jgi:cell division ATPase FtsA